MYHLRKLKCMLLLMFAVVTANAQPESGKVYRFVNKANSGHSLAAISTTRSSISTTAEDYLQYWFLETHPSNTSAWTLRNLGNGKYLQHAGQSTHWSFVDAASNATALYYVAVGDYCTFNSANNTSGYTCMHYASSQGGVVGWESSADATQWTMTEVSITSDELAANWEYLSEPNNVDTYQAALSNLFTDYSCSVLKDNYTSYTMEQMKADENYLKLSTPLKKMVLKMCSDGTWKEANYDSNKSSWDADYAKKYRVQLYEPYNEPECAANALGLNAHTNLNNPTGIFSAERMNMYIMVEGAIKEGAHLYLASYAGHGKLGGYNEGVELHEGLNVVTPSDGGLNYCINYVVETFDTSDGKSGNQAKKYRLSDYDDLKIHIEGGYINGYYNKVGDALYGEGDKNADWEYLEARATQTDVTVLGKYITLQFPLLDENTVDEESNTNKGLGSYFNELVNVEDCIDEWDNVMLWERLLLGILDQATIESEAKKSPYSDKDYVFEYTGNDGEFESDYSDYYNVHGLSYGIPNSYMYGSWDHCGYHYNTMDGIVLNLPTDAGSHWGPGHEIGHQHQKLLTVNGLTEVTNNLFANVVLWYYGETTSRVNGDNGALSKVLEQYNTEGADFFSNNIWALTHMYYKLFLYYHVLGHNPKFYPYLFEMLRQDPMSTGYIQSGTTTLLHFYKKCCLAAGEDLTEFFRAYGFFEVMTDRFVGDYANSIYTQTQADIDAAIAEVKALKYDENLAVLFINDATGETIKSHKGDDLELYGETTVCAEVGSYASFNEDVAVEATDYECVVSGESVTMTGGTGGVGFAIYNDKGEILAFSDKTTFTVSDECAAAIVHGEATLKVVNADSEILEVELPDQTTLQYDLLGLLLNDVESYIDLESADNTKPGYYREADLASLKTAFNYATEVYDNQETLAYAAAYDILYKEYKALADVTPIPIYDGGIYMLTNKASSGKSMSVNDSKGVIGADTDASSKAQHWIFDATEEEGVYKISNVAIKDTNEVAYLGELANKTQVYANATETNALGYKAISLGGGTWALQCQNNAAKALNYNSWSGNVIGWKYDGDEGSHWYLNAVSVDATIGKLYDLQALVDKTKDLIDKMAEVTPLNSLTLQTENSSSTYYLSTNACHNTLNNASDGQGLAGLLDDSDETYFHSDYNGKVSETHYLQVYLGDNHGLTDIVFNYTTRANGKNYPVEILVQGSSDGTTFDVELGAFSDLPTGSAEDWVSPIITIDGNCRYLRFSVTAAAGDKKFFVMSDFGINKCEAVVHSIGDVYAAQDLTEEKLVTAYNVIHQSANMIRVGTVTEDEVNTMYGQLETEYTTLETIYNNVINSNFTTLKSNLQTLMGNTNTLIAECGEVTLTTGAALTLTTTAGDANNYLTGGPSSSSEGNLGNLLDNDVSTSYTSNWNAQTSAPYLQVQLPDGQELSEFTFTFTSRNSGNAPTPTKIVVSGSNDGAQFTDIVTFTDAENNFPEPANNGSNKAVQWTSPTIEASTAYKYLRFTVTESDRSTGGETDSNGFYHFGISEFGLSTVEGYSIAWTGEEGGATEELLLAAYKEVASAQVSYEKATTEAQLQAAIDRLQADYDALSDAKNSTTYTDYTIQVTGGNGNGGVVYGDANYTTTLNAPATLTVDQLTAIPLDGYVAKSVTLEGTTITVIYNKVYTVQVTGGGGNGGVTYEGNDYADGMTFEAPVSLTDGELIAALTAIVPDGYTLKEMTVEGAIVKVAYAAIPLVDTEKYYTLECLSSQAHSSERFICDNGTVINGRSAEGSLFQFEAVDEDNGYYIKSYVTDKYLNHADGAVYASTEKATVWTMAVPSHTTAARTLTVGDNLYLNNNGSDCSDGTCTNLQSLDHTNQGGAPLSGNACSLWTITEGTPLDKSALEALITATNTLIESCYTDGVLNYPSSAYVNEEFMTTTREAVDEAQVKYDSKATTASEYTAALEALTQAKTSLENNIYLAEQEAAQRAQLKAELNTLIEQTEALMAECGTYGTGEHMVETPVVLQTTSADLAYYLSTNADQNVVGGDNTDGAGIAALIDGTVDTYMHTQWSGTAVDDDHYVQVNLGDGMSLAEFTFTYATRKGSSATYTSPAPTTIELYGSNDGSTFTDKIATFTSSDETNPLISYTKLGEYWASENIKPTQTYDYLRFYVTASAGPSETQYGGHYFFAMSEFALTSISYETGYYVESLISYGNVTEELFLNVAEAKDVAESLVANSYNEDELEAAATNLQALYDELNAAHNDYSYLPVTLTADVESPVLYMMGSKRGNNKLLQYNADGNNFSIVDATMVGGAIGVEASQLFYFTKGSVKGQVYVHPFTADGKVLAASDKTDGANKVSVAEMDNEAAMQWTFEQETVNDVVWYSLKAVGASTYFSNWGGVSNKMGFYGSKDDGSRFTFTTVKYHTASIGQYLHTSLYLDYAAVIPEGVKAYIAKNPSEEGTIDLVKLEGGVLPANTGVILYSETPDTYHFFATEGTATDDVSENLLKGSTSVQYVGDETGAKNYYIFGQKGGEVGLYWARMDYTADGSYVGNDEGTHFKASANKVYLELDVTSGVALSGFRFRIGEDETGIKSISTDADATIYDLYGRRIVEVVTPGIYIINGEKRYINIK